MNSLYEQEKQRVAADPETRLHVYSPGFAAARPAAAAAVIRQFAN